MNPLKAILYTLFFVLSISFVVSGLLGGSKISKLTDQKIEEYKKLPLDTPLVKRSEIAQKADADIKGVASNKLYLLGLLKNSAISEDYAKAVVPDLENLALKGDPKNYSKQVERNVKALTRGSKAPKFNKNTFKRAEEAMVFYYRTSLKTQQEHPDLLEIQQVIPKLEQFDKEGYHKLDPELEEFKKLLDQQKKK